MTIDQRLDDAEILWSGERYEGGFLMALVAFAATARKVYPTEKSDRRAFEMLFQNQFNSGTTLRFRDEMMSLSRLFYTWLRCQLVHEAGLPPDLRIDSEDVSGLFTISLTEGLPVAISATWYHSLIISVIGHPVNADVFPRQDELLQSSLEKRRIAGQRVLGAWDVPVSGPPQEDDSIKSESARRKMIILSKDLPGGTHATPVVPHRRGG